MGRSLRSSTRSMSRPLRGSRFDHRVIRRLGEARPELRRGILLSAYLEDPVSAMRAVGATTLWQEWQQIDRALVNKVHDAGGALIAWTVNEIGDLERLARMGVDGLCGNYPDRMRVALAGRVEQPSAPEPAVIPRCPRSGALSAPRRSGFRAVSMSGLEVVQPEHRASTRLGSTSPPSLSGRPASRGRAPRCPAAA